MAHPPLYQVDAFTTRAFHGNPAAVCVLADPVAKMWMQAVAREMNLSETAFVRPTDRGWSLRWFTPKVEVPLCGHATLATAHVLWAHGFVPSTQPLAFLTASGTLHATVVDGRIQLDFPRRDPVPELAPAQLIDALGVEPVSSYAVDVGGTTPDFLFELGTVEQVRKLRPELDELRGPDAPCFMVTARGDGVECDFVSRYFAPAVGIDEDPVTGSAHCALAPYWAERLGKARMLAHQISRRRGELVVEVVGDRVRLSGSAVTVLEGRLSV